MTKFECGDCGYGPVEPMNGAPNITCPVCGHPNGEEENSAGWVRA